MPNSPSNNELETESNASSEFMLEDDCDSIEGQVEETQGDINASLDDPGLWPDVITPDIRALLIANSKGPIQLTGMEYPIDDSKGRRFTDFHYIRKLPNNETVSRSWLVYSRSKDCVFCFCCKIFLPSVSTISLASQGYCDWQHISASLQSHEASPNHMKCMLQWTQLQHSLNLCTGIDAHTERIIQEETKRWQSVFEHLIAIIKYLTTHNLAFRGSVDKLYQPQNGNFLGLVELLSQFDPVMGEHVRLVMKGELHTHYLGKDIQNELLSIMASQVREKIVSSVHKAKYFSILLDCTPDVSHQEQLSVTIRYVSINKEVLIEERFIQYIAITETIGASLTETILDILSNLGLNLENLRGQGYDNGANMVGRYAGVQAHILEMNNRAFFTPCCSHSLNLVLGHMAKSCSYALSFFGIVQRLYVFFSASTKRWHILKNFVTELTVKPLSETRWECRVESVKAIRFQTKNIIDALLEIADETTDPMTHSQAISLAKELKEYQFLVAIVFWYDMLNHVNVVSKTLQGADTDLSVAIGMLERTVSWLKNYRNDGFQSALTDAKEIAEELGGSDMTFPAIRVRRKKRLFDYESADEPITDAKEMFRIQCFNKIVDTAISDMDQRF